ncbi:MAG: peptide deformylase [Legionellales bacterium]|nr:peptide deformylase [Legionellales bacterium]
MSIRTVKYMGEKCLETVSTEMSLSDPALKQLIPDMFETMKSAEGIGLAAPQIGVNQRVLVFGFETSRRYPNRSPVPYTALVNPKLEILTDDIEYDWEGCVSLPKLRGYVPRFSKIRYEGFDENGKQVSRVVEGFHARLVQHEYDHLEGILFHERITDRKRFGFEDVLFPEIY